MPTTHLPGHLDSARQKLRPKHQLLVLKCYPRLPKNSAADVAPNGSELSYLLYYASTRRTKLPKLGAFLEQKTAADVRRYQSARVLVTLQILTALLEHKVISKAKGFALIALSVLRIICDIITGTNDISLIEATVDTWNAVCRHQDHAALAVDVTYRALYEENVALYAALARNNTKKLGKSTQPVAPHDGTRLRKVGVSAIKCIYQPAESISWGTAQTDVTLPAVVSNLRSDEPSFLHHIHTLYDKSEDEEKTKTHSRRLSMSAARTFSGMQEPPEADPRAAEGTAQDADNLEEEEVGVLAMGCLREIFQTQNRAQTRGAAVAFLQYVSQEQDRLVPRPETADLVALPLSAWATTLFRMITSWTPVQERFILLITVAETLRKTPLQSNDLRPQLLFAELIDAVLRSDLNLIGLSVMDVLLGLLEQLQRTATLGNTGPDGGRSVATTLLMQRLQSCISDLATHVYYSDQITDMISTIVVRIRADASASGGTTSPHDAGSTNAEGPKSSTQDFGFSRPGTRERGGSLSSGQFHTSEGRLVALSIIKDILHVARKTHRYMAGTMVTTRSTVPVAVWEHTQWLLDDPSPAVVQAYKDALTAWAEFESDEKDARILDFSSADPVNKLIEKARPAESLRGSLGPSIQSHRQLFLAPLASGGGGFSAERRMSNSKVSSSDSNDASNSGPGHGKPRVRYQDLKDICEGRKRVAIRVPASTLGAGGASTNGQGTNAGVTVQGSGDAVGKMLQLLDSLQLDELESRPLGQAPS